jgi:hypothetical protein
MQTPARESFHLEEFPNMRNIAIIIALIGLTMLVTPALGEWSDSPTDNNLVNISTGYWSFPEGRPDGQGGMFLVWSILSGDNAHLYATRVDAEGNYLWTSLGVRVCTFDSHQTSFQIVTDMAGGIIVVWSDEAGAGKDIYSQRLDGNGNLLWNPSGQLVYNAPDQAKDPVADSDGQGGVVVGWYENRTGDHDIFGQRLNSDGAILWGTSGAPVCTRAADQAYVDVMKDGIGGATFVWADYTSGDFSLRAQRLTPTGTLRWPPNGVLLASETPYEVSILSDGGYGYYAAFLGLEDGQYTPKVQRFDSLGNLYWSAQPLIAGQSFSSMDYSLETHADNWGNLFLAWTDNTGDTLDIRVQKISRTGLLWYGGAGKLACSAEGDQEKPCLATDGEEGVFVGWTDGRFYSEYGSHAIYAQRLDAFGQELLNPQGNLVHLGNAYRLSDCMTDGNGGFLAAWLDKRYGGSIFAQRLDHTGHLGNPAPLLTSVADMPNDQGGQVQLGWDASYLDDSPWRVVESYSVWMRLPVVAKGTVSPMPEEELHQLSAQLGCSEEKLTALVLDGWTFLQQVPAVLEAEYGCLAPTYGDSTGTGIIFSEYRVLAHGEETWHTWESQPVEGYSVDNLAPGAPLALSGEWTTPEEIYLQWQASGHHDEDLFVYNIYRSQNPGVEPDPANLVGTATATNFSDPTGAGTWFYRVTAVDVHGNESPAGNEETLSSASDVPEVLPERFALNPNFPNPFNPMTTISFDLPEQSRVDLAVYSLKGELIATLLSRDFTAGNHEVTWNGTDQNGRAIPSGMYFAHLVAGDYRQTRSMVLVR